MSDDESSQSSIQNDWDLRSEEESDTDDESRVLDQVRDILDENLNIRGAMVYFQTYGMDAPNPCITIKGFGPVGFPLNNENARALMAFRQSKDSSTCRDFGKELIELHNPVWEQWVQKTVLVEACERLGLDLCRCELDKMTIQSQSSSTAENASCISSLQSEGSQLRHSFFLPRSTRITQLGSIEISLPSQFTGGDVTVAYPTMPSYPEKLTKWSEQSEQSTTVLGVRCGYVKAVAPIQTGYRVSLSYRIIAPQRSEVQPIFDPKRAVARLRDTLSPQNDPPGVVSINLSHKYQPSSSFNGSSLIGPDEVLLSCIRPVADVLGLKLLVANIVHERSEYNYIQGRYDSEDDESDDDDGEGEGDEEDEDEVDWEATRTRNRWDMSYQKPRFSSEAEIFSFIERHKDDNEADFTEDAYFYRGIEIKQMVDLDGMPVTIKNLDLQTSDIIHDAGYGQGYPEYDHGYRDDHFWENEDRGEPDVKEFDSYADEDDFLAGYVNQKWNATILLICQKWVRRGVGDRFEYAYHRLQISNSDNPNAAETAAVEFLMEWCGEDSDESDQPADDDPSAKNEQLNRAASVLTRCAIRWNDIELFSRVVRELAVMTDVAGHISVQDFVAAYNKFFWVNAERWLVDIITAWETSRLSYGLVSGVMQAAITKGDTPAIEGCQEKRDSILSSLKPVDRDEVPWLVEIAKERGIGFFRDHVLSSLREQNLCVRFWLDLGKNIWSAEDMFSSSEAFLAFISDTMKLVAQRFSALAEPDDTEFDLSCSHATKMNVSLVMDVLALCVQTGNTQHCGPILEQMMSWANRNDVKELMPWQYYSELAGKLDEFLRSQPDSTAVDDPWAPFFRAAAEMSIKQSHLNDDILATITISLNRAGGVLALKSIMNAEGIAYMAEKKKASLKRLALNMHANLLTPEAAAPARRDLDEVLMACASAVIEHFDFASLADLASEEAVNKAIALLKFCFDSGVGVNSYPAILDQLLSSAGITRAQLLKPYLTGVLVPLIGPLRTLLIGFGISIKEGPIKTFFSVVTRLFVSTVVGKKPSGTEIPDATTFGCGCSECERTKYFLHNGPTVSFDIHDVQRVRAHVEKRLQVFEAKKWSVEWGTVRGTRPLILRISKPEWLAHRQQGLGLLDSLGDTEIQKAVLGEDLPWILGALNGSVNPNNAPLSMEGASSPARCKRPLDDSEHGPSSAKKQKPHSDFF
ncbi:uncharacterized protein EV420DRAFT_1554158 [Desarmillaria tabescens]|uniref:Uncharacterized protein n=1 Tax=Armillaria tabescens TaxID=1929756 RepID=A0AA39N292_ARMTA|nr:uncharacterized protein EV420DRAFT_1554158 [Desarmillaria tabescens]KAK0455536.1 hypothetical protein EV420DRAFT_1554158 [Desarmillaria tabescens]